MEHGDPLVETDNLGHRGTQENQGQAARTAPRVPEVTLES